VSEPSSASILLWVIVAVAAFPATLLVTMALITVPLGIALGPLVAAVGWDLHLVEMGLWPIVWGALACAAIWGSGRALLGISRLRPASVAFVALGFLVAAWHHVVLQQWEISRFGYVDPDLVGWTAGLFALVVGVGVAAFGASVAPRPIAWLPTTLVVAGFLAVIIVAVSNLGGVSDGVEPDSFHLAATIAAASTYALLATHFTFRRLPGRRSPLHNQRFGT
jgi:hypothetical protein